MKSATCGGRTKSEREPQRGVPGSVNRVLGSTGSPLDPAVRRTLEPRFGHDFSRVRVHSDVDAARSAADIHARAWTVSDHIAFAPGAYAPQTREGRKLLAHELTHVTQQSGTPRASSLSIGPPRDAAELEADRVASAVSRGENAPPVAPSPSVVRGQFDHGFDDPWPEKTEAAEIRAGMPAYLEWRGTHPAGFELSKEETATAEKETGTKAPGQAARSAGLEPRFVLHDTDADMKMAHFQKQVGLTGPKGAGVMAWIPGPEKEKVWDPASKKMKTVTVDHDPVVTRPAFFESKRPTTTGFEKGEDIIGEAPREAHYHAIWNATATSERGPALDRAVAGTGLSAASEKELKEATDKFLTSGAMTGVDGTKTTAGWAVAEICARATDVGADAIANPDKAKHAAAVKEIESHCGDKKFAAWLQSRNRIGERTNVEIAQVGGGKALPNPPYSEKQYEGVASMYLRAALAAQRWPFVSTHRYEDRDVPGGHNDPRCFNVHKLYGLLAKKMAHPAATIYGLEPKYGGPADASANVSWTKAMCHADPPA